MRIWSWMSILLTAVHGSVNSNVSSFYIPPNISESYPFSALEDTIAKFLQVHQPCPLPPKTNRVTHR